MEPRDEIFGKSIGNLWLSGAMFYEGGALADHAMPLGTASKGNYLLPMSQDLWLLQCSNLTLPHCRKNGDIRVCMYACAPAVSFPVK